MTTPPPTPPAQHPNGQRADRSVVSVQAVRILTRNVPLAKDLCVSSVIGPNGGRLSIPRAGIDVEFSPGAVTRRTEITLTATDGDAVAYQFEPHGLKFAAPVVIRQDLRHTAAEHDSALAAGLQGSYFTGALADDLVGNTRAYARIKERRPAKLKGSNRYIEFSIEHFSGYMVSTGLVSVDVEIR